MSTLQLLDARPQPSVEFQLSELDSSLEQSFHQAEQPSYSPDDVVFRSRYRPQTFASVEEMVARDIEAFSRRRTRIG